jgi:hypothetical protein
LGRPGRFRRDRSVSGGACFEFHHRRRLLADWKAHGDEAIVILRNENPTEYCKLFLELAKRDPELRASQFGFQMNGPDCSQLRIAWLEVDSYDGMMRPGGEFTEPKLIESDKAPEAKRE